MSDLRSPARGGSCTCRGGIDSGGIWHDTSRCPIHAPILAAPVARPPVKCPVCLGRGTMPHSFYDAPVPGTSQPYVASQVSCRSCGGRGIV